jgi:predicted dinucleotide-binding enzyme
MRIGILGAGSMASAFAPRWAAAGHEIFVGGRTSAKAQQLAETVAGGQSGTLRGAAEFGEVCLLATSGEGLAATIEAAGGTQGVLHGKVIIDCGNAVYLRDFSQVRWDGRSLAEQAEFLAMGSRVVKAFNLCEASVWRMAPPIFDGRPLAVPYCGADEAKQIVRPLIEALGCRGVDIGDLSQARHLEAMAIVMINILRSGFGPRTVFNLIQDDRAA